MLFFEDVSTFYFNSHLYLYKLFLARERELYVESGFPFEHHVCFPLFFSKLSE